jgi:hypothetical protein
VISHLEFEDEDVVSNNQKMISDVRDSIHDVQEMMTEMGLFVKEIRNLDKPKKFEKLAFKLRELIVEMAVLASVVSNRGFRKFVGDFFALVTESYVDS